MSPITHLLVSWVVAESCATDRRERFWICAAGLAPDLDGLGILMDLKNQLFTNYVSQYYAQYHHFLLHGLFGAVLLLAIARAFGVHRWAALLLIFASFHLHLFCDLIGARGPSTSDIWVIHYLGPFTRNTGTFYWTRQWPLNGWPNMLITVALMTWALWRAIGGGVSPVSLFSARWDAAVVQTLRLRWTRCAIRFKAAVRSCE
jgi:inner membrane protein